MREIKLRAWDKQAKKMISDSGVPHTQYGRLPDYNYMIFTGLKDVEGKEIYEGDVLEQSGASRGVIVGIKAGLVFMHITEYKQFCDGYPVILYEAVADMQTSSFIESCTVIGNIYENPNLLK
jgi:uncharacterized phage protein (TIGR01671 family)